MSAPARHQTRGFTRGFTCGFTCGFTRGFTLVEMLVVLAIVGVLASIAVPLNERLYIQTQERALREALRSLRSAIDAHREEALAGRIVVERSGDAEPSPYPARLSVLYEGVPLADEEGRPRADGARLYLLRRLPRDPFADPAVPAEQTWELRGSDSPPDRFGAGRDVFDLRSRSKAVALDGSAYESW